MFRIILAIFFLAVTSAMAALPATDGTMVRVKLNNNEAEARAHRLTFCVFENGEHDLIFVGCRSGMWSSGKFDLSLGEKVIYSGKVDHLLYEGRLIDMGDVLPTQPKDNSSLLITRIEGIFK